MAARPTYARLLAGLTLAACSEAPQAQSSSASASETADVGEDDPSDDGSDDGAALGCDGGPYQLAGAELVMLAAGTDPRGVTLGDVDGDGNLDVLASARADQQLLVFLGHGDGSFATPQVTSLPDGLAPEALRGGAIADGVFDVVTRSTVNTLTLVRLRGDGSGGFYDPEPLQVPSPIFVLDRVTANAVLDLVLPTASGLRIYPGSLEQESFISAAPITSSGVWGSNPGAIGLGDFDDDGDLDVAVAIVGELHVGLNNGAAMFGFGSSLVFDGEPTDIATGDLDGDGHLELVLTTRGGSFDAGHVFRGHGDGTFGPDELLDAPSNPICVDVVDFDEDGRDDVAMVGGTITAYLTTAAGFEPAMQVTCVGSNPRQLSVGDLNGDCIEDAVTVTDAGVCISMSISDQRRSGR